MASTALAIDPAAWATLLGLVLGPGIVATALWSAVLASSRLRSLFRSLPLTGSTAGNYVLVAMGLSLPWIVGLGWEFSVMGAQPGANVSGEPLFTVALSLSVTYIVGIPLVAGLALPRPGIDWDDNGYGAGTWLLLLVSSTWYATIFAVPIFLVGIVVSLPH